MDAVKARVFISCGQSSDGERKAAAAIAELFVELGFDPYVAIQEQSLRGLTENIFALLEQSEYFLFVDFRREQLLPDSYRGSLFSHQELAIASYLDLPFMGFRQTGVRLEGVLGFLQGNCVEFQDIEDLASLVRAQVEQRQNGLQSTRSPGEYDDAAIRGDVDLWARFFHLRITNQSRFRTALGCRAYIGLLAELGPDAVGNRIDPGRSVELKWAFYTFPDVIIPPERSRDLDIGYVLHGESDTMRFLSLRIPAITRRP